MRKYGLVLKLWIRRSYTGHWITITCYRMLVEENDDWV
jgi:hypothetical protein